jgi:ParB/RepB/Spo0J family partition protein
MEISDQFLFRCTHCGNRIPWRLVKSDVGIAAGDEPEGGKVYPFEKCSCGWGKFIQCENQAHPQGLKKRGHRDTTVPDTTVRDKINRAEYRKLPLASVHPNPKQPRKFFDKVALQSLADSIATIGQLEDILVRADAKGDGYEIILGERRWRATQLAALETISTKIVALTDAEAKIISLVENLQREDLTDVEEAFSFKEFVDRGMSAQEVGDSLGKLTDRVADKLRLLSTPHYVQFQEERIRELTKDNEDLKTALRGLQGAGTRKYTSRILKTNAELLEAVNDGWELVAQLGSGEFLVRSDLTGNASFPQ